MKRERHVAYDQIHASRSEVWTVRDHDELRGALARASRQGRRVTVRGAGMSLDAQALGDDVTLRLAGEGFAAIDPVRVSRGRATVRAGAAARWGDVFDVIAPQGYVTPNVVTGSELTVGGTVASDCLSRFSGAWGKEAESLESVEVVTPDGALRVARADAPPGSLEARLFAGVVGGFGAHGVIVAATYRLRRVARRRPHAKTVYDTFASRDFAWADFFARLRNESRAARAVVRGIGARAWREALPRQVYDAVSATVWVRRMGPRGILIRSRHVSRGGGRTTPLYEGLTRARFAGEVALSSRALDGVAQTWNKLLCARRGATLDDLDGFSFFMDGNAEARRTFAARCGRRITSLQQTYVVPERAAAAFAQVLEREMAGREPTVIDALWLPRDERDVFLSATRGLSGFAITLAYQTVEGRRIGPAKSLARLLARRCAALGGRVSLVKNVYADDATLAAMYADGIAAARALRAELDPAGVLGSPFLDRLYGQRGAKKSAR